MIDDVPRWLVFTIGGIFGTGLGVAIWIAIWSMRDRGYPRHG